MTSRHHHSVTNVQKQKNRNKMKHDGTSASLMKNQFPVAWNEARPETQLGPKKSALKKKKIISLMYTNSAAGSLRHKCYDPGKPNNHTTVQFLTMLQWSYHQMYYSPFKKTGRQHFKKESAPRYHHHQRRYIYIYPYVYIHTPNHRDTRIFV